MKIVIPLILLVLQFILSICFQNLEGVLFGYHIRTIALVAVSLGQILSLYLLSMLVLYLVEKIQTRNGKRLIVGSFILLFAFLWRLSLVDEAKMSQGNKSVSIVQSNPKNRTSTYDKIASNTQRKREIEKVFFEVSVEKNANASAQMVDRFNLQHIQNEELTSRTKLAKVVKDRRKTLNEVSREMLYDELVKAGDEAGADACAMVKEKYKEFNCSKYINSEERRATHKAQQEITDLFYDYKEAELAFAQFILDHYEDFTFASNGEIEDVVFDTEAERKKFVKLAEDVTDKLNKLQSFGNKYTKEAERQGWL